MVEAVINEAACELYMKRNSRSDQQWMDYPYSARGKLDYYVTDLGERAKIGTRLDLVLNQSPFSRASVADLDRVIPPEVLGELVVGVPASGRVHPERTHPDA